MEPIAPHYFFGAGAGAFSSKKSFEKEPELSAPESVFRAGAGAFDSLLYFRL